jgi:4-hydroxythreonine-4-phosphate dehydrogenase
MSQTEQKPAIGISCGDLNGIGVELIIKTVNDNRLLDICTPVIFANNKVINFYRKGLQDINLNFVIIKDFTRLNPRQVNVFNCWEDEVPLNPGQLTDASGRYAVLSLVTAAQALKDGHIQGLVTAPIHKKNTQSDEFNFTGHTPYLKNLYGANDVVMLMTAENTRVGLLTEHVPLKDVASYVTRENLLSKLTVLSNSLKRDFNIDKPRIAVLGLNPHAGDEGLIGNEEIDIIKPTLKEARQKNILCFGPYSADAFFARGNHENVDAVLAMYHDQGLIPFKSLAKGDGVNFTAGISGVRTSPDHGVAFDIAGKGIADESSFRSAIYRCVDILRARQEFDTQRKNPLRKLSGRMVANAVDEALTEE